MGYTYLSEDTGVKNIRSSLAKAVVAFIRSDCEDLRFDEKKAEEENQTGVYQGTSQKYGQIPYNMEMDIDRLCLERSLAHFLESGRKADAYDIYMCYIHMYLKKSDHSLRLIEMLSEYEENGSSLLMKHRDHFSHSVYVFSLGIAIFHGNQNFRNAYQNNFPELAGADLHTLSHHFLRQWGLAALFHDTGYPYELPFEQVESFFEVFGGKRSEQPYMCYAGMDKLTSLSPKLRKKASALYKGKLSFDHYEELLAHEIVRKLGKDYVLDEKSLTKYIAEKPTNPENYMYFLDHAWFSALNVFNIIFGHLEGRSGCRAGSRICKRRRKAFQRGVRQALAGIQVFQYRAGERV